MGHAGPPSCTSQSYPVRRIPCFKQVPHDNNWLLLRNCLMMGMVAAMASCFGTLALQAWQLWGVSLQ